MARDGMPNFFLNISTVDPAAAETFFTALGMTFLPDWSETSTKSFLLPAPNNKICLMVHAPARFKEFIRPGSDIVDAHKSTEALFSLAVEARDDVDAWVERAVKAGGTADPYKIEDCGQGMGIYTRAFADLDGHIWEVLTKIPAGEKKE